MKIVKAIAWIGGISAGIWGISKLMKPKTVTTPAANPGTTDPLAGKPNMHPEETTNFDGGSLKDFKNATGKIGAPKKRFDPGFNGNQEESTELLNMGGPLAKLFNLKPAMPNVDMSRMKAGTKGVIRGEICEWDGSNWVNCKKLGSIAARMKSGTKAVVRGEICEWDGSNWVNCKKLSPSNA